TASLDVMPAGNASYDATVKAPRCATVDSFCDTGSTLIRGRANISGGAEPNAPNTIASTCADGTAGSFHADESLDRLRIPPIGGPPLGSGKPMRIEATVWPASTSD